MILYFPSSFLNSINFRNDRISFHLPLPFFSNTLKSFLPLSLYSSFQSKREKKTPRYANSFLLWGKKGGGISKDNARKKKKKKK
jgi:hypothetical protein